MKLFLWLVVWISLFVPCSVIAAGSISGTAVDVSNNPLENITATASQWNCSYWDQKSTTTTDVNGNYNLNVANGIYQVTFYDNAYASYKTTEITIVDGSVISEIDAQLVLAGSLDGIVTDVNNVPIEDIDVYIYELDNSNWQFKNSIYTDSSGYYNFSAILPGIYRLRFSDDNWQEPYFEEYYNDVAILELGTDVEVTVGNNTSVPNVIMTEGGHITGIITDDDGNPLQDVYVSAYFWNDNYWDLQTSSSYGSGSDGMYELKGLPAGEYAIEYNLSNYITEYYPDASDLDNATKIAVSVDQTIANIDAQLVSNFISNGGFISGIVTDTNANPLQDIKIIAFDANDIQVNSTYTDSDGSYILSGLDTGNYRVLVQPYSYNSDYVKKYYLDQEVLATATEVQVTVDQTTPNIDIQLNQSGHITGTVIQEDNSQPLLNASVTAYQWNDNWWDYAGNTYTDDAGFYDLRGLASGDYRLEFSCYNSDFPDEYYDNASDLDNATDIAVTIGNIITNIDVLFRKGIPAVPSNFIATVISQTEIELSWDDNSDNETGFKIFRNGTELTPSPKVLPDYTSFNDIDLLCETDYTYQLVATNDNGDSETVSSNTVTTQACAVLPLAPTNLTATAISDSQINLNWTDSGPNETGFKIFRNGTELTPSPKVIANIEYFNDTSLSCGKTYSYELKATNIAGDSNSISTNKSTKACPLPVISKRKLSIKTTGNGTGSIEGTDVGYYRKGKNITLTATADSGSDFIAWTPDICEDTFRLNIDTTCTAEFVLKPEVELVTSDFCQLNPDYSACQIFSVCQDDITNCNTNFKMIELPNSSTVVPAVAIVLDLSIPTATPIIDIVGLLVSFTAYGDDLNNDIKMVVEDCENMQLLTSGNSVNQEFFCTQLGLPGIKKGIVKNQNDEVLYDFEVDAKYDCNAVQEIPVSECKVLSELYNEANGKDWKNATTNNWLIDITPCAWKGITCTNDHVARLRLPNNNLTGNLPDICLLTELEILDLSDNAIQAQIPSCLPNLELANDVVLSDVVLSNEPPIYVSGSTNLTTIDVSQSITFESYWSDIGEYIVEAQVKYCLQGTLDCKIVTLDFIEGTIEPKVGSKIDILMNQVGVYDYQFRARDEQPLGSPIHNYDDGSIVWQGGGTFTVVETPPIPDEIVTSLPTEGDSFCEQVTEIPQTECKTLVDIYTSTQGQDWENAINNNWLINSEPCSWTGISCDNGHVIAVDLSGNQLTGTVPDLTALVNLEDVNLSDNCLANFDPTVIAFLDSKNHDWETTQDNCSTIVPVIDDTIPVEIPILEPELIETVANLMDRFIDYFNVPILPEITSSNNNIKGYYTNRGGIVTENFTVEKGSSVSNLTIEGKVVNHGSMSNVTIGEGAELIGGKLTGYITNNGLISDFEFVGASVTGGTLSGYIYNNSEVGGSFIDVTLSADTVIDGGILEGEITGDCTAPALLKNVTVKSGSVLRCVSLGENVVLEEDVEYPSELKPISTCNLSLSADKPTVFKDSTGMATLPYVLVGNDVYFIEMVRRNSTSEIFDITFFCKYNNIQPYNPEAAFMDGNFVSEGKNLNIPVIQYGENKYSAKLRKKFPSLPDELAFVLDDVQEISIAKLESDIFNVNVFGNMFEVKLVQDTSIDKSYPYYWRLKEFHKIQSPVSNNVVLQENKDLAFFSNLIIRGKSTQGTLEHYYDPKKPTACSSDPTACIWKYVECPDLPSHADYFKISNPSCRQKRNINTFINFIRPELLRLRDIDASSERYNKAVATLQLIDDIDKYLTYVSLTYGARTASMSSTMGDIAIGRFAEDMVVKLGKKDSIWWETTASGLADTAGEILALPACVKDISAYDPKGCLALAMDVSFNVEKIIVSLSAIFEDMIANHFGFDDLKKRAFDGAIDFLTEYYSYGGNLRQMANIFGIEVGSKSTDNLGRPTPDIINWLMLRTTKAPKFFPQAFALKNINSAINRIELDGTSRFENVIASYLNPKETSTSHKFISQELFEAEKSKDLELVNVDDELSVEDAIVEIKEEVNQLPSSKNQIPDYSSLKSYPIDVVGYVDNTPKNIAIEIITIYLTAGNQKFALQILDKLKKASLLIKFLDGISDYSGDPIRQVLYTLEFVLSNSESVALGSLLKEGSIIAAYDAIEKHFDDIAKTGGTIQNFYVKIEVEDGNLIMGNTNINDATVKLHRITHYKGQDHTGPGGKYVLSQARQTYDGSYTRWYYGYSFQQLQSGLFLAEIIWKDKTYLRSVFAELKDHDTFEILLSE